VAAGLAVAVLAGIALVNSPSVYTATAQVQLLRPGEAIIGIPDVAGKTPLIGADVLSEMSIIASPRVLRAVAERLELRRFDEFAPEPSLAAVVLKSVRDRLAGRSEDPDAALRDPDAVAAGVLSGLTRARQLGLSSLIEVSVSSTDPSRAAEIANAIAEQYLSNMVEDRLAEISAATRWFEDRLGDLSRQIDQAGTAVAVASAEIAGIGGGDGSVITRQIADLSAQLSALRAQSPTGASGQPRTDAERRADEIAAKIAGLQARLLDETTRAADLRAQTQRLETLQQVQQTFLTRLTEVRERASFQQPTARVVTPASVPTIASAPKRAQLTVLAFLAGSVLAAAFVLYREWRADGVKTVSQLARLTGLPVLAEIPQPRARAQEAEEEAREETAHLLATLLSSTGASLAADHPGLIIAVLSALPGEGSGRLATRLAVAAAAQARVALLRANPDAPGDKTTIRPVGVDVLRLEEVANPRDALASSLPSLEALANRYDLIVVDAPPVLVASDAALIARRADAAVLVVQWRGTPRGSIRKAMQKLADLGAAPSAAALVDVDPDIAAAFGYAGETIARRRLRSSWGRARPRPAGAPR
jgi:uncharacterized protein involved in exopolysaccharide biosynthesis